MCPPAPRGVWHRQLVWLASASWRAGSCSTSLSACWSGAPALYAFSLLLLVRRLVVGTGAGTAESSHSWLSIGGHQIGQPSELAKVATVLMMARYLSGRQEPPRGLRDLIGPGADRGVPFLLVLRQPDLGSALVFIGIFFAMLFWAGVRPRLLFLLASPVVSLLLAFNTGVERLDHRLRPDPDRLAALRLGLGDVPDGECRPWASSPCRCGSGWSPYQQNRLLTFLNPEVDPRAAGYHAIQSRVAIGSGGWFGTGYTEGPQKRLAFLPEQHTDFVFSVVGEELGFVGVVVALSLFLALFLVLVRIARRATDPFSSLAVFGIVGPLLHPRVRERGDDGESDADHRHSAAVVLLRRLVLHYLFALPGPGAPGCMGLEAVGLY